jgi:phosphohistidine phosphatase
MTTKTLYLLRHAKSDWDDPSLSDHDRPLAARGRRAAPVMAEALRARALAPALVLCSTATRTRQTWALVKHAFPVVPSREDRSLYTFDHAALVHHLQGLDDALESVLVVGHNPALQDLALMLCNPADENPPPAQADLLSKLNHKFPTAAFAAITLNGPWSELAQQRGKGTLQTLLRPKDLP